MRRQTHTCTGGLQTKSPRARYVAQHSCAPLQQNYAGSPFSPLTPNTPSTPNSPYTPRTPKTPIDADTMAYLRSPTAFEFDDQDMKASHRRSKHVWSARLQACAEPLGANGFPTPPLVIRKKSDGYSLIEYETSSRSSESTTIRNHQSYRSPYDLDSPSKDCTREELDPDRDRASTYSSYPPTPTTPITPSTP